MRALLFHDLALAARAAALMSPKEREARLLRLLASAHAADKYRKRTGRAHPQWGNGTFEAALRNLPLAPPPRRCDPPHCEAYAAVLRAITRWRLERDWNRRALCITLEATKESDHGRRPPSTSRRM